MRLAVDFVYSFRTLAASKSRTFLTMLGIIIGVMSVLAVISVGLSAQQLVVGQVKSLGSNLVGILPGGGQDTGPPPIAFGIVTTSLKIADADVLRDLPHIEAVTPYVRRSQTLSAGTHSSTATVSGVNEDLIRVEDFSIGDGRFLSSEDVNGFGRVVVLGYKTADTLFPGGGAVGQFVRIKGSQFEVIGVMAKRGTAFFQDQDDQAIIPVTTAQKFVAGVDYVTFVRAKIDAAENIDAAIDDIRRTLRRRHGISDPAKDDFTVRSAATAVDILGNVTGAIKGFLLIVTAISLIVGGINIMNVMFVAVRERTREIGLRKALGAHPTRILLQFLMESAMISFMGGAIGTALGVLVTWGVAKAIAGLGYDWQFVVPLSGVTWSLGISVTIGLVFGVWPAASAARLEPISALRYE
ncbi:MAG TPA: ABC transporter permease [Candidatus Eisenbacteria bacterium]|jgi:putative ABC transport system permease protein|nr:ABC transporter permease [Candidatus Eisenbacteria bacterium]